MAGCVALFLLTVGGAQVARRALAPAPPAADAGGVFALDFIAFYTGGALVNDGRHRELFDLRAVKRFQDDLAARNGATLGGALGPWWNPPFYAWVFAPLARLPFGPAAAAWVTINVACAAAACWLLVRMLPRGLGWRTWSLVPLLVALSVPFIHAVTHGQNACTSLLIVTAAVTAWRADRPVLAGLVAGLMAYKPQHAVVLGGVLALSAGWRAVLGLAATGTALLLVTVLTLPGALGDFLTRVPQNVRFVQEGVPYLWERHATLKAFWRLLLQGYAVGPPAPPVALLNALGTAALAVGLLRMTSVARWMNRFDRTDHAAPEHRDRLIAATVLATPLVMPFYFDYDLLLLAVPAVLLANLHLRAGRMVDGGPIDRAVRGLFPVCYAWLLVNADVAEHARVNLIVPLIGAVAGLAVWPGRERMAVAASEECAPTVASPVPMAKAA